MTLNNRQKAIALLMFQFFLGFLLGFIVRGGCSGKAVKDDSKSDSVAVAAVPEKDSASDESSSDVNPVADAEVNNEEPQAREIIYYAPRIPYSKTFADLNDAHLEMARKVGLKSVPGSRDEVKADGLVYIEDNDLYVIDNLRYSVPYLTKGAAKELNAIAQSFADSLARKKLLSYKLVVSSVLRTEADVNKLRRSGNPNASDNSAHCYGTTFDITYTRYHRDEETDEFMQPFELTKVLAEVLRDRHNAGQCLIKYEKKEHCFHITSCH